jgi:DNA-binding SARP family transcriptional activator
MSALRILLFGCPRITHDGTHWYRQETRKADAMLAYLLLNGPRVHPRDRLTAVLWDEVSEERARGSLRTTLWRLRKRLEPHSVARGTYLVTTPAGEVGLNWQSNLWSDVGAFERSIKSVADHKSPLFDPSVPGELEAAVELYKGDLLEGFSDDWVVRERERLRDLYFRALVALMRQAEARGEWEEALGIGQRILALDPMRESIHRALIRLHLRLGQRVQALRQYRRCSRILWDELGVEPMPETRGLWREIMTGANKPALGPPDQVGPDVASVLAAWSKL